MKIKSNCNQPSDNYDNGLAHPKHGSTTTSTNAFGFQDSVSDNNLETTDLSTSAVKKDCFFVDHHRWSE